MKKSLLIIIICLIIAISAITTVSAQDNGENTTITDNNDKNTIELANDQQNILQEGEKSFNDLNNLIHNDSIPENAIIELDSDYTYQDSDEPLIGTGGITIDKNITIDGKGYTLNGAKKSSIFNITNNRHVILKNITFINGEGADGGAIHVDAGSSIEIKDSTFQDNHASNNGGAIFIDKDTLTSTSSISNTIFTHNIASKNGGAIYDAFSTLNITLSTFSYDNATYGGGIYIGGVVHITQTTFDHETASGGGAIELLDDEENYSTIENSTFQNCYSIGDGGAGYIRTSNAVVKNVKFINNTAGDDGGALYWEGNNGIMYNITCTDCRGISRDKSANDTSSTRGGAICLTGNNTHIYKSTFTSCSAYMDAGKNSSKVDGGAIFATGNDVIISEVSFSHCSALDSGGSLYVIGNDTHIIGCSFDDSNAKDGAALYVEGDLCHLYNSTFTNNIAEDDGGAIYWTGSNGIMYNITCTNNKGISSGTSSSRGGTICLTGDNVTVSKSSFKTSSVTITTGRDSTKIDGGALFLTGNNIIIRESVFDDCEATHGGAAAYIIGNNTHLLDCNYTNTQALVGGAIFISGNDAVVDDSLFRHNDAKGDKPEDGGTGGAIYVDGDGAIISNSDFAYGSAINYGGTIAVWGSNALITKNTFDNSSTALFHGGSIFISGFNATISLSNFTRSKTNAEFDRGGAIDVSGDECKIFDCNFDDCYSYFGGAIEVSGVNAMIKGTSVKNSKAIEGGAIYVDGVHTTILESNFTNINSDRYGGAIYVKGTYANISGNNFFNCSVKYYHGGAIYVEGANANIEKSNFTSCNGLSGDARGGAICIEGANTVIDTSIFDKCNAVDGGDIYVFGNGAIIKNSILNSSSAKLGGAIYLYAWGAYIIESNFTACNASLDGGAVFVAVGGGVDILQSNFDYCIAKGGSPIDGGGAIYINGPDTHISGSNFNNNKVSPGRARGGTIYINGVRTFIESSNFNGSQADQGGIIYIEGENAIINSSTFSNSSSVSYGGAIAVTGHDATIRGSYFENIHSDSHAGAIYVDGADTNILTSSFYNCVAASNGGSIFIKDVRTTVAFSNFTLSRGANGGAIFINGDNTTVTYCNLDNNSASSLAGAIQIDGTNTLISNCNLDSNTATTAGAIKVTGSNTLISDCNLTHNIASTGSGGAMDLSGENASVHYSNFYFNDAYLYGGAMNWEGGHGDDSIIGSTFVSNSGHGSGMGGGAIFWTASKGTQIGAGGLIKDSIFINNTAHGHHGGAIDWFHAIDSKIDNCLFINNTAAADGGALYTGDKNGNSLNFTIVNSQFYNNAAGKHGGAIANQMTNCYIYNNTFDGNKAGASGGTILMKENGGKNSIIDYCYIYNSYCDVAERWGESGGAIHIGAGDTNVTISNSAIINSTCDRSYGGAISMKSKDSSLINVTIQNVQTCDGHGGAIFWSGDDGTLNNVTIFNSSAHAISGSRNANGGAIFLSGANCNLNVITIIDSSTNISNSRVKKDSLGGAIYVSGAANILTNVIIDDSQASTVRMNGKGGAIYWAGNNGTLINATISNTLANGEGGAIYWSGSSPVVENISIEYSKTNVTDSSSADGGAIYSTSIGELNNVYIINSIASKDSGDVHGGAIYFKGNELNNVTVLGSRASTDNGISYGGAVYWKSDNDSVHMYNSLFEENTANLGGALYSDKTTYIDNTIFAGNVARDGGAIYIKTGDIILNDVILELNSAKRGGALFAENTHFNINKSTFKNNTAEEKGGAIYRNFNSKSGTTFIRNTEIVNNTAFQGSAIYATKFFELTNVILLDNQANSKEFIDKHVGVDETGRNYTSAVFVGFDNVLNAMWVEDVINSACKNVTYWGVNGINVSNSKPRKSDREVWQNVTIEVFNGNGEKIRDVDLVTDDEGRVTYYFNAVPGETYYFAFTHETDRYYTHLRDTLSNRSLVKIYAYTPLFYNQNQTLLISLTDGAWGDLNGTVTVKFNDTVNTTFVIEVINGTYTIENISGIPIGKYNVTATFDGDIDHTGDSDWTVFEVLPYDDLHITKDVNITADAVNVTDIIKYTINVTNHGPSEGRGVNVTEVLSPYLKLLNSTATRGSYNYAGGYWYIGDLGVNETVTLTIIAQVIHEGPITNTVWVNGLGNDTNITNNVDSAHNFTAFNIVDLRIVKEINVTKEIINVTNIIKYTITVYNDGPCNATGVFVAEVLDYHLAPISINASVGNYVNGTWNIGNLDNGKNATLTIVARVIYSGNITNEVRVTGYENDTNLTNNYDNVTNVAVANVDLQINKTVNVTTKYLNVTDQIKFTITIYNAGPANATGVYVSEILSKHLRMISYNATIGKYDGSTWIINQFNAGEIHNLTIIAEIVSAGIITNDVNITSIDNDTNITNNYANITNITALPIVDIVIRKEVNITAAYINVTDTVKFTITVHNNGPCDATGVNVTEKLSSLLQVVPGGINATNGTYNVNTGIWDIGNLPAYSEVVLTIVCKAITNGTLANMVIVKSVENDTNTSNNNDTINNITILPIVNLIITKEVNESVVNVTDQIRYTITVYNDGPSNATQVNISEILSDNLKLISNVTDAGYYNKTGGYWYIGNLANKTNATLTLVCEVIKQGYVHNYVNVTSYENDTDPYDNSDYADFIAFPIVDVMITKDINIKGILNVTNEIVFTITVHNNGPCNATNVRVNETLDSHLEYISHKVSKGYYTGDLWYIGDLNNGSTETLNITAKVKYDGNFSNFVVVSSHENDTNMSNNRANITNITAEYVVDMAITKRVDFGSGTVKVGDLVQFTINVNNYGPCDATNVTVIEKLSPHLQMTNSIIYHGQYNVTTDIWYIGDLACYDFAQLIIQAKVISPGIISNFVVVNSTEKDSNETNNNDTIDNITAVPAVNLVITKSVNQSLVFVGDYVEFTVSVFNKGPCNATRVNVTEIIDNNFIFINSTADVNQYNKTGGYWYIGDLAVNETVNLTIICQVDSDGIIPNYVEVTSYENETYPYDNWARVHVATTPIVDVAITKRVNTTSRFVNIYDIIEFTITVTNYGPSDATSVLVAEPLNRQFFRLLSNKTTVGDWDGFSWNIGNLARGASENLTIVCEVIALGNVTNFVNVTSYQNDTDMENNYANITNLTSVPIVDLSINKTVTLYGNVVKVGDLVQFDIKVSNAGPCTATNVTVIEKLNPHLEMTSIIISFGKYNVTSGIWSIGDLAPKSGASLTIQAKIISNGTISNFVIVTSNENDTNTSNNNDTIDNFTAMPIVSLNITKEVNQSIVNVTGQVKFTITVHNAGPSNATQVNVTELLSDNLKLISNVASAGYYNRTGGYWYIGNLANNTSANLTLVCEVTEQGYVHNYVNVTSYENDTDPYDNSDYADFIAFPIVDVWITKDINVNGSVNVTDEIVFTITVHNKGPCNATNVRVNESLDSHLEYVSHNASKGYYYADLWYIGDLNVGATETLNITVRVKSQGNFSNFVVVSSYENDTDMSNNKANITNVTAYYNVDLEIHKTVILYKDIVKVGDYVEFRIEVINNGPCDARNVTVIEKLSPLLKMTELYVSRGDYNVTKGIWDIGVLPSKEVAQLFIGVTVISNGTISNVVIVNSTDNDTNKSNDNDTIDNITAFPAVDLVITKIVNQSVVRIGDMIRFNITVFNKGPSNATKVNVTEVIDNNFEVTGSRADAGYYNMTGGYWYIGNLAVNETVNLTIECRIKDDKITPNYVEVTSYENETYPYDNWARVYVSTSPIVDIAITKKVNVTTGFVYIYDMVEFNITVHNYGPSDASSVLVAEPIKTQFFKVISNITSVGEWDGFSWNVGDLAHNATETLTIVCQVIELGNVTNFVNVTSYQNDTNTSNNYANITNLTSLPIVDLSINKTVTLYGDIVKVGDLIQFTINLHNAGPCTATNITVIEKLSRHLEMTKCDNYTGVYDVKAGIWHIDSLPANASTYLIIEAKVISNGTISNFVIVSSNETDTNTSNNNDTIDNITAVPAVDLVISKGVNESTVNASDKVKFTITVYNKGPSNATKVNVSEILDKNIFGLISNETGKGYYNLTGGYWYIGDLKVNETVKLTLVCKVLVDGMHDNYVNVTSYEKEENPYDNWDQVTVTALKLVDVVITKKANVSGIVNVSDIIKFTVNVTNNGPSNASGVWVEEILDRTLLRLISVEKSENTTFNVNTWVINDLNSGSTKTLILTCEVIAAGNITNFVTVYQTETDKNESNNKANVTNITSVALVNLTVVKKANVTNVNVGELVKFTINVTNYGPSNATNVNITDVLDSRFEFVSTNATQGSYYRVGKTIVWNIPELINGTSYAVELVVMVLGNGTIENIVSVVSTEDSKGVDNKTTVNATYLTNLTVVKKANVTNVNVGELVKFTINVTNYGPSNATNVNVTDVLDSRFGFVSANGTYTRTGQTIIWNIPKLANNTSVIIELTVMVLGNGTIENIVSVNSTENKTGTSNTTDVNATYLANLTVIKKANVTEVNVGEFVKFTIIVTNYGPSNATNVNVTDILDSRFVFISTNATANSYTKSDQKIIWHIDKLQNNTSHIIEFVVCVLGNGTIENIVSVNSTENTTGAENKTSVNATYLANLTVIKKANVTQVNVGEFVKFTIAVTNYGPSNATDVNVTDVLDSRFEFVSANGTYTRSGKKIVWNIPKLVNGTVYNIELTVMVLGNGTIENIVSVNSTENTTGTENKTSVNATYLANLTVIKKANITSVNVGEFVKFTIIVTNYGPSNATDVNVTDVLDSRFLFISANGTYTRLNKKIIWNIPKLSGNASNIFELTVMVLGNGTIENIVSVNSTENTTGTSNKTTVNATYLANLTVIKKANVTQVNVGEMVKFTINVTNYGPSNATDVNVTDILDSRFLFISANGTYTRSGQKIVWNIPKLANNTSVIIELTVMVLGNGTIENIVSVNSTENTTGTSNKTTVNATNLVNLTVIKTADVNKTVVGGLINFTITVTNNGPTNATKVSITDNLINEYEFVNANSTYDKVTPHKIVWLIPELASGKSVSVWIQVRALTNGTFTNVAVANSTENTTNVVSNESNVTVDPYVNFTIVKYSNVTGQNVSIGDLIKFTIVVTNIGLSNATNVLITDELNPAFEFNSTNREYKRNGNIFTWNISKLDINTPYIIEITVKAVLSGFYSNVAVVNSTENPNNTSNKTDVTILPAVNLTAVKKADVVNASVGDMVNFTIIITNHGPSDATNVTIVDILPDGMSYIDSGSNIKGINGSNNKNKVTWIVPKLANGESVEAWITVMVTQIGTLTNVVTVNSTENTTGTSNKTNVTVNSIYTPIDLNCYDIYYGDVEIITVTLPKEATGTVNITVGNRTYNNVPIDNGVANVSVYDLGGGDYNVTVVYGGDGKYLPNSTAGKFKVLPITPTITIEVVDIWVGEVEVLNVTVNAPGTVFVTVNGETVEIPLSNGVVTTYVLRASKLDYNGRATWNIHGLPVGTYPAFALYPGNENYTSVSTEDVFHVRDKPSTVVVTADDIYVGEDAIINIKVGPEGVTGSVVVEVEGKNYTLPINNGRATLTVPGLKAGLKHVKVWYKGTLLYRPSQNTTTFKVLKLKPPIDIDSPDIEVGEDGKITVTVPDDATGKITIKINGKTYTKKVKNGKAVFTVPGLKVGVHDIEAYYSGDDKYLSTETTGDIRVTPAGDDDHGHTPRGLEKYPTGNPIMLLVLVVLMIGVSQIRRFKK